jgi:hypothetical protein
LFFVYFIFNAVLSRRQEKKKTQEGPAATPAPPG